MALWYPISPVATLRCVPSVPSSYLAGNNACLDDDSLTTLVARTPQLVGLHEYPRAVCSFDVINSAKRGSLPDLLDRQCVGHPLSPLEGPAKVSR